MAVRHDTPGLGGTVLDTGERSSRRVGEEDKQIIFLDRYFFFDQGGGRLFWDICFFFFNLFKKYFDIIKNKLNLFNLSPILYSISTHMPIGGSFG